MENRIVGFKLRFPNDLSVEDLDTIEAHRKAGDIEEHCPGSEHWNYTAKTEAGRAFIASLTHGSVSIVRL